MTVDYREDGELILNDPVPLPDVLDMLIVGGGPAGTAAAFRAKELGLNALVIDFDDLMKRIRDYPKDKLILPSFGGGDKMKFPAAGDLVVKLYFPDIDKDDMCGAWKGHYRESNVPARVGVELTGLESLDDGSWQATTWNHRSLEQETYRARYVVLALGRGVPRRFDIPGDIDGIAYRMSEAERYVDGPVCVIGGGTSAAEAVIAISKAKAAVEEECPVVWSYRGSKMPRVSKALADVFFEAYVDNGNVRYYPHSEPVAVVRGPDRNQYLSILVDRKAIPGRPQECAHLEFPKERCIACIGEDIPEALLKEFGIHMVVGGSKDKKMMAVTPLLETQQPGIFLIGDLLSQAYLETEDFHADPSTFQRIKHRGNIKSSLRDGVFVAEVIQQKLEGREKIEVFIRDAEPSEEMVDPGATQRLSIDDIGHPAEAEGPPAESIPPERDVTESAYLVRLTAAGIEEDELPLKAEGVTSIGRSDCDITFPEDTLLSENHASITHRDDEYFLRDDGSKTGTYLRLRPDHARRLSDGDLLRVGRQILVVQADDGACALRHHDAGGKVVGTYPLPDDTVVLGRSGGKHDPDVVLSGDDMTLSRFHLSITRQGSDMQVEDFNSRNGTFLRVVDAIEIEHDDVIRVGGHLLRLNLRADAPAKTGSASTVAPSPEEEEVVSAPPEPEPQKATPQVTFAGLDVTLDIDASETILEVADENDVELDYECWIGKCGCDLIKIVEGREHLNEVSEDERKTIERRGADPGECRLACMTRASGPVVVEIVD